MAQKNLAIALLASVSLIFPGNFATAQPGKEKQAGKERGKGHNHKQMNGHNLLGAKLKQNGKHVVGKLSNRDLTVEAVGLLGDMRQHSTRINAITEEVVKLEEQADELNDSGINRR